MRACKHERRSHLLPQQRNTSHGTDWTACENPLIDSAAEFLEHQPSERRHQRVALQVAHEKIVQGLANGVSQRVLVMQRHVPHGNGELKPLDLLEFGHVRGVYEWDVLQFLEVFDTEE